METYIFRRQGWQTASDLGDAAARSRTEAQQAPENVVGWRTYGLAKSSGELGTIGVHRTSKSEAIRARRADLPVDEIVKVAAAVLGHPDRLNATATKEE
jgi:hypothetical protein